MNWNQPKCEHCWIRDNIVRNGDELGIRQPIRVTGPGFERCAWCGSPTIFGVYVREHPDNVPFPAPDDEEGE